MVISAVDNTGNMEWLGGWLQLPIEGTFYPTPSSRTPDELHQPAAVLPHRSQLLHQQPGFEAFQPEVLGQRAGRRISPLGLLKLHSRALKLSSELAVLGGEGPAAFRALHRLG